MVIPADWKEVRLGDIGSTFGGLTGKTSRDFGEGNSRYITFMNVMSNVVLSPRGTERVRISSGERQTQVLEGDVIFNGSSETPEEVGFGSAVPATLNGLYLNSFCFGFRVKDLTTLNPNFFALLTRSPLGREIIRPMAQGSTRYNIAKTNLLNGRFPIPPLKEQEAIAEALSDADAAVESLNVLIAKKRDVKQGTMQQLLTGRTRLPGFTADWKEVRLGDIGSTFGGLTGKTSRDFGEGNSRYITFMNVMSNVVLSPRGTERVRISSGERQTQVLEGDVIFNGSSETPEEVGFGSAVPATLNGLYLNSFCFGFRVKDLTTLNPNFFALLTRSPLGREIIRPMAQGSTRYNIAKTNLLNGRFPIPPLKEQEAIAEALSDADDELEALTKQVTKLQMVKEGMMQDLLTGKVRLV